VRRRKDRRLRVERLFLKKGEGMEPSLTPTTRIGACWLSPAEYIQRAILPRY
jgi:hypothetical protein